jgi:fucose permease
MPIIYNSFVEMNGSLSSFEAMKFAYAVLIPCFAYIVWYAAWGYRIKSWRRAVP